MLCGILQPKGGIRMKKTVTASLGLAAAGLIGVAIGFTAAPEKGASPAAPAAAEASSVPAPLYRLGESDGKLAVYLAGKSTPELVFDVWIHNLPDVDRERLGAGIDVPDEETLTALIEDYTS